MIQFYAPDIRKTLSLPADESLHCAKVLRKKEGDFIYVTDGIGNRYECHIVKSSPKEVKLEIIGELLIPKGWGFNLTLAVAITKNGDRMAWLVEKATEIGIDNIIFLDCQNNERHKINIDRLKRNAVSAMNQSLKTRLPDIEGIMSLKTFVSAQRAGQKFFGYCDDKTERHNLIKELRKGTDVTILIGPEGDFSPEEVSLLQARGFLPTIFINSRLRTETAALFGVEAAHIINEL